MAGPWEKYQRKAETAPVADEPSVIGRVVRSAVQATPVGAVVSLYNDPIGTIVGMAKSVSGASARDRAIEQGRKGNYGAAIREGAASLMGPGVSMIADSVASADADRSGTIETGELPELVGTAIGAGGTAMLPKAPTAAKSAASNLRQMPKAALGVLVDRVPGMRTIRRVDAVADKLASMFEKEVPPPPPPPAPKPAPTFDPRSFTSGPTARQTPARTPSTGPVASGTASMPSRLNATAPPPPPPPEVAAPVQNVPRETPQSPTAAPAASPMAGQLPPELAPTLESLPPKARAAALALYEELQKGEQTVVQPKILQKADFENAARAVKADTWAEVLHGGGISSADVALMTPEMWTETAKGLGFRLPSKTTRGQIIKEVSRREKMMRVQ